MNLERLKWTKSVTPQRGESWAYLLSPCKKEFHLNWKANESNACKPKKADLILLTQKSYVSHLVQVLDDEPKHESRLGDFSIYREVKILWIANFTNLPKVDDVFGFPEILRWQNGDVKSLETSQTFKQQWSKKGGLKAFQKHVTENLKLTQMLDQLRDELNQLNEGLRQRDRAFDPAIIDEFFASGQLEGVDDVTEGYRLFCRYLKTRGD